MQKKKKKKEKKLTFTIVFIPLRVVASSTNTKSVKQLKEHGLNNY